MSRNECVEVAQFVRTRFHGSTNFHEDTFRNASTEVMYTHFFHKSCALCTTSMEYLDPVSLLSWRKSKQALPPRKQENLRSQTRFRGSYIIIAIFQKKQRSGSFHGGSRSASSVEVTWKLKSNVSVGDRPGNAVQQEVYGAAMLDDFEDFSQSGRVSKIRCRSESRPQETVRRWAGAIFAHLASEIFSPGCQHFFSVAPREERLYR